MNKLQEFNKIKSLLDQGVISKDEYFKKVANLSNNVSSYQTEAINANAKTFEEVSEKVVTKTDSISGNPNSKTLEEVSIIVDDIYLTEDSQIIKPLKLIGEVSSWCGISGFLINIGIKKAEKQIAYNAKKIGANVVLITSSSFLLGVKLKGSAYKM